MEPSFKYNSQEIDLKVIVLSNHAESPLPLFSVETLASALTREVSPTSLSPSALSNKLELLSTKKAVLKASVTLNSKMLKMLRKLLTNLMAKSSMDVMLD